MYRFLASLAREGQSLLELGPSHHLMDKPSRQVACSALVCFMQIKMILLRVEAVGQRSQRIMRACGDIRRSESPLARRSHKKKPSRGGAECDSYCTD